MKLEPGFVPDGWKRGDLLQFVNGDFRYGPMAAVSRSFLFLDPFENAHLDFAIRFHHLEAKRVQAWLRWWHEETELPKENRNDIRSIDA
jgi:hypothetical protein